MKTTTLKQKLIAVAVLLALLSAGFFFWSPHPELAWMEVKNAGKLPVTIAPRGGHLPTVVTFRHGFLPVPQRTELAGVTLASKGWSGKFLFAPGARIEVLGPTGFQTVWRGRARSLKAEVDADDSTNIVFRVISQEM